MAYMDSEGHEIH